MFKKLLVALVMVSLFIVGSVSAKESPNFASFYGPNSECFMTMRAYYVNDTSPAWICSAKTPVVVATAYKAFVVFFDFDSAVLDPEQQMVLEDALLAIKTSKAENISLTAFCDFRGPNDYNLALGAKRIDSVRDWFSKKGLDKEFAVTNYGKMESPIRKLAGKFCSECWNDRRVEIGVE